MKVTPDGYWQPVLTMVKDGDEFALHAADAGPRVLFCGSLLRVVARAAEIPFGQKCRFEAVGEVDWSTTRVDDTDRYWAKIGHVAATDNLATLTGGRIEGVMGKAGDLFADPFIGGLLKIQTDTGNLVYRIIDFDYRHRAYTGQWPD